MVFPNSNEENEVMNDREKELKAFDETKAGVKGLVDADVTTLPRIFIHPLENLEENNITTTTNKSKNIITIHHFKFPIIDLVGLIDKDPIKRKDIVDKIMDASRTWGFFQVVSHGIPTEILEEMLEGVRGFHEQETEAKKQYYSRDFTRKMIYNSNFDLFSSPAASWRDSFTCIMAPDPAQPEELPSVCREIVMEYSKYVMGLGITLFSVLSEALRLNPNHLTDIDCAPTLALFGHYYPACPQPELTIGTMKHSDYGFLTILLQDNIGGLQVLHQNQWVDVPPEKGALVVNIGDLQLISNDRLKSVEHRVLASRSGPRISVACFFGRDTLGANTRVYRPIEELLTKDNPPLYRAITIKEYTSYVRSKGVDGTSSLKSFKL